MTASSTRFERGPARGARKGKAPPAQTAARPAKVPLLARLTAEDVLGLQKAAGNAAVSRLIARTASPARPTTVQRDVGFEFESPPIRTRQVEGPGVPAGLNKKVGAENMLTWQRRYQGASARLPKGEKLMTGTNYTIEADDRGGESDLEVVTGHFPESATGRAALQAALDDAIDFHDRLKAAPADKLATTTDLAGGTLAATKPNAFFEPPDVYVQGVYGAPQMTMGLGLKDIPTFVEDLLGTANGETKRKATSRAPGRKLVRPSLITKDNPSAAGGLISGVGKATEAINVYVPNTVGAPNPASPELKGLLTLIYSITETVDRDAARNFMKSASDMLAKTDYATLFKQLPGPERAFYAGKSKHKKVYPPLVDLVASAAGYANRIDQPVFDVNTPLLDEAAPGEKEWYKQLTLKDWLRGMTNGQNKRPGRGKDLLTTEHFPKKPSKKTVEGFGVLGSKMDKGEAGQDLPIVEFRSFARQMDLEAFAPVALKLFDYVRSLNSGNKQYIV